MGQDNNANSELGHRARPLRGAGSFPILPGRDRKDAFSSQEDVLTQTQAKPPHWGPSLASLRLEAREPGCPSRRLMLTLVHSGPYPAGSQRP